MPTPPLPLPLSLLLPSPRLSLFRLSLARLLRTTALALAFSATLPAQPPPAGVSGRIQNIVTGQYLTNARVTVRGTDQVAFTDDSGIYRLTPVTPGPLVLDVFYTGLDPQEVRLQVDPGAALTRDVALTNVARYGRDTEAVKLDPFIVTTSRDTEGEALATNEQRFAPNLKAVISTDSFGDMAEGNVGEFLKYLPGIAGDHDDAQINTISLRGFSTNHTLVLADGAALANANFNGSSRTFQFSQLAINNVSRIEVAKVPTPATPADSMAGSVNMVSKSAFERSRAELRYRLYAAGNGDHLTLAKRPHSYERRQRKVMPGVDFDYTLPVNKNFGVVLTASRSLSAGEEDHSTLLYNAAGTATGASVSRPYLQQYGINDGSKDITRNSASVKADWRVTPNSVLSVSAIFNQYQAYWGHQSMDFNAGTNGNPTVAVAAGGLPLVFDETQLGDPNVLRGTIDIRNSGLKPWTADNFDVSLEYYTNHGGLVSAGVFLKEIEDFFANNVRLATAADHAELGLDPQYVGWQLSTKFNSGHARVAGAEFNFRHTLRPLGAWGRFFTVFANATRLELSGSRQADFAGFIPKNVNWGVTFAKKPVTLIAKWNYRGEQKGAAFAAFGPDAFNYTKARLTLDLSADYQINKRLSLNTNIRNLFNEYLTTVRYGSSTPAYAQPRQYRHFGVYFSAGIKGTF